MSKKKKINRLHPKEVLEVIKNIHPRATTLDDLYNHFEIYDKSEKTLVKFILEDLVYEGKIYETGKGRYSIEEREEQLVEGTVDFVNENFGFIRYDENKSDIFVAARDMNSALDGDKVRVKITKKAKNGDKNPEGEVVEVLQRARTSIVGKIKIYRNYALVSPDVKGFHDQVFIPKGKESGAKDGELVIVELTSFPNDGKQASGIVSEVLGPVGDNNAEMHAILAEFGLPNRFPKEVEEAANSLSGKITEKEMDNRRDMREVLTFTIDPADAKDFDDALSFEKLENGRFQIGVHIADVSHYVTPGSTLDKEAFHRATSVYLVDRTIPMLPEKLSNNLCSLRPNEDRLAFSVILEMNESGKVITEWFGRTVIHSDARLSYDEAQEILDGKPNEKLGEAMIMLNNLAHKLRDERFKKGAFNFETDEVQFQLDAQGKPLGVFKLIRKDAHKLIEEFMLLANKRAATYVARLAGKGKEPYTMVYRIHEPPNPDKIETYARFLSKLGYTLKTDNEKQLSKSLNKILEDIEGKPIQAAVEGLAIRAMSKARYSTENVGHFGLAFDYYSHFTSPIRRYPDILAHRLLQHYLDGGKPVNAKELEEKCVHSSEREKLAADADRASIKYKQVEYMMAKPRDEVYKGVVSGVTDFGIFVEIDNMGIEGMVRLADLEDDFYDFDADNYKVVGRQTGRSIGFGVDAEVRVLALDLENRNIDFELLKVKGLPIGKAGTSKGKSRNPGKDRKKKRR